MLISLFTIAAVAVVGEAAVITKRSDESTSGPSVFSSPVAPSDAESSQRHVIPKNNNLEGKHKEYRFFYNLDHDICFPRNSTISHLNRGKPVISVNSVNDDTKPRPLFDALSKGFKAAEVGVWLLDTDNYDDSSELYVGGNNLYLAPHANLKDYYLKPMVKLIDEVNCKEHPLQESACDFNGVFYEDPEETFILYIDMHTEGTSTYSVLMKQLKELVDSEYLTYYDYENHEIARGPITVVLTGAQVPYEEIIAEENKSFYEDNKRYVFIDAPLEKLAQEDIHFDYSSLSMTASGSLGDITESHTFESVESGLSDSQIDSIKCKVDAAHELGLITRVFELPDFPKSTQSKVSGQLLDSGVDILNAVNNENAYNL